MTLHSELIRLPERGWSVDPRAAVVSGLCCWAGVAIVAYLVVSGQSAQLDELGLQFWRSPERLVRADTLWAAESVRDITALGGVLLRNLVVIGAACALLFLRLRRESIVLVATVVSGWGVNTLLKQAIGRSRPEIIAHLMDASGPSFPSGHSFNAAVAYLAIALAFVSFSSRRSVRFTIVGTALLLSLTIAWTRVWLGVHFPTDVVAGWLGGVGWALLSAGLMQRPVKQLT